MRTTATACFLLVFVFGVLGPASAIDFSGFIQDSTGNPVAGITVYKTEDLTKFSNPSAGDGGFTVAGLPSGANFSLKFDGPPSYAILYSKNYNRTADASGTAFTYTLATPSEIADWYANSVPLVTQIVDGGTIRGRVTDSVTDTNIGGAMVTYTSSKGNTYPVYYYDGTTKEYVPGQATFGNGRYFIFNVADGETVKVTASKTGWIFSPITFETHAGTLNVSGGSIFGKMPVLYLPLILKN